MPDVSLIRHRVTITLDTPALIGTGPEAGFARGSRSWIPGETILGALAGAALRDRRRAGGLPDGFVERFREGHFGPALADDAVRDPMSVGFCKYTTLPTCRSRSRFDLAWQSDARDDRDRTCPECGRDLELGKGVVRGAAVETQTHVRLDAREVGVDGDLFRRESIARQTTLTAGAWLPDAGESVVRVRLGGAASTQGAATVRLTPDPAPPVPPAVTDHLDRTGDLVVRLESPTIVIDRWGRPATHPREWQWLLDEAFPGAGAQVSRWWTRWTHMGGWQAGGLPKPVERALEAGSVLVIRFAARPPDGLITQFRDDGLGLRHQHGFGWVDLEPWTDRPDESDSAAVTVTESDLVAFTLAHRELASKVLDVLRSLDGRPGEEWNVGARLAGRSWFRALPARTQRSLVEQMEGVSDPAKSRLQVDDALRTAVGDRR